MDSKLETTIEVKLDKIPDGFNLVGRILGDSDENISYVKNETAASITHLVGQNKKVLELRIKHNDVEGLKKTEDLIYSLVTTVREDYQDFLAEQPPFIKNRYKADDLKCNQKYLYRGVIFDTIQAYEQHMKSKSVDNSGRTPSSVRPNENLPAPAERKDFVGTITSVKGFFLVISDSIICDTRSFPSSVKFKVGDRVKGIQMPASHPTYKWKAVSLNLLSITKNPPALLGNAPGNIVSGVQNKKRVQRLESQLLKAFSFFLNEQTTPKSLWNTHHRVQTQAKNRPMQRPQMMQSPTFCMLCNQHVVPAATMPGHLGSAQHRIKYVEKQLELGLEKFPQVYGSVPLPGIVTNNGKRLAVDALTQFFGYDLPSHNADAYKSMILLNGAIKNRYCEVCNQSMGRYDFWIQHVVGSQHATKCVQMMATQGLHAFLQRNPATPAPTPNKMKEAIKNMTQHLLKNSHLQEYTIETETLPDLDAIPEQPAQQIGKPGLLGDAPMRRTPGGLSGGPRPLSGFVGGPGDSNKRALLGDNFTPRKKPRAGLLGAAPSAFDVLDNSGEWQGGFGNQSKEEWVGSGSEEWDAPRGFKVGGRGGSGFPWNDVNDDLNGEYVGGFGGNNDTMARGRNRTPKRLLEIDTERDWDSPDQGEFVGGGGDDSFVGGGDPNFLPTVVNPNVASILEAAQGLMNTVQRRNMAGGTGPLRRPQGSQPEMVAVQALSNNLRSLMNTLQTPQMMQPQRLMNKLTPQDLQYLHEVKAQTGIQSMPLLIRLVQTMRSLPVNVFNTLTRFNPQVLFNQLGAGTPQEKLLNEQIISLLRSDIRQPGVGNQRPGLLGDRPLSMIRRPLSGGLGRPSLLDMPVTFRC